MAKLTIDGVEYDADAISEMAKAQLTSIQFCENELRRLQAVASSLQAARNGYINALKAELTRSSGGSGGISVKEDIVVASHDSHEKAQKNGFLSGLFGKK